jgi:cobalt-zinc-cadmium efflux system protein
MPHKHEHSHHGTSHGHSHAQSDFGRAFAIGIALNMVFIATEAAYGFIANSMALLADAGHNLSDVLGLAMAWLAASLAKRPPSSRYSYGYKGANILASLANAVLLLVAMGALAWEAVLRFAAPEPVASRIVIVVAIIGICINLATAMLFARGRNGDINIRGAYMHMVADAAVSAAVVIAGFAMLATGWLWLDPAITIAIVAVIVWGTWGLLRDSLSMSLQAVPRSVQASAVRQFLESQPGVLAIHDLHIWGMSTTEVALTVHLVMDAHHPGDAFLMHMARVLKHDHGIAHVTIQIETDPATECDVAPDHVV